MVKIGTGITDLQEKEKEKKKKPKKRKEKVDTRTRYEKQSYWRVHLKEALYSENGPPHAINILSLTTKPLVIMVLQKNNK